MFLKHWWKNNWVWILAVVVMFMLGLSNYVQAKPIVLKNEVTVPLKAPDISFLQRLMEHIGVMTRRPAVIEPARSVPVYPSSGRNKPKPFIVYVADFTGMIYTIGTSITNGYRHHDAEHSRVGGGDLDGFYNYFFDKHMKNKYCVKTDISSWYRNWSWRCSWDKYNLGTGGFMNTFTCANGVDPWPSNSSSGGRGMCLDCVDDTINMTWGRGLWRIKDVNWSGKFLIVEGGHHDGNPRWEGENCSGMALDVISIYEQSRFYGYTLVLLGHLPVGRFSNQNMSVIRDVNIWRKSFADNHSDMVFVDLVGSVFFKDDGSANESWFVEGDGWEVHPNKRGLRVLGELVADCVYGFWVEQGMI